MEYDQTGHQESSKSVKQGKLLIKGTDHYWFLRTGVWVLTLVTKTVPCSHLEYPICNCVHSYSNSPFQTPFWDLSLAGSYKAVNCPGTNKKGMHTGIQWPLLMPEYRDSGTVTVPEFRRGYLKISGQWVPYPGTVTWHQVWLRKVLLKTYMCVWSLSRSICYQFLPFITVQTSGNFFSAVWRFPLRSTGSMLVWLIHK